MITAARKIVARILIIPTEAKDTVWLAMINTADNKKNNPQKMFLLFIITVPFIDTLPQQLIIIPRHINMFMAAGKIDEA